MNRPINNSFSVHVSNPSVTNAALAAEAQVRLAQRRNNDDGSDDDSESKTLGNTVTTQKPVPAGFSIALSDNVEDFL
jgi:hypothetical protein